MSNLLRFAFSHHGVRKFSGKIVVIYLILSMFWFAYTSQFQPIIRWIAKHITTIFNFFSSFLITIGVFLLKFALYYFSSWKYNGEEKIVYQM